MGAPDCRSRRRIDANDSSTECASTIRSRSVAGLIADVVVEQRLGLEAEGAEHRDRRLLVGDDLHDHLPQTEAQRLEDGVLGERPADPAAATVGVDDHAYLADVARPALQRHDRDIADDESPSTATDRAAPESDQAATHLGVAHVLLEERPVAFGDARHELLDGGAVARFELPDLHQRSLGGSSSSLCSASHASARAACRLNAWLPGEESHVTTGEPELARGAAGAPTRRLPARPPRAGRPCPFLPPR